MVEIFNMQFANRIRILEAERDQLKAAQATLFDAIAHGDEEHRVWLKKAIDAHFAGQPVPPPTGKNTRDAAVAELVEGLELADKQLAGAQPMMPTLRGRERVQHVREGIAPLIAKHGADDE